MQHQPFDPTAPKKSANLSINSDLLRQSKELHINLSQVLESQLTLMVREQKLRQWLQDNDEAITDYNRRIEQHGAFSDGLRNF